MKAIMLTGQNIVLRHSSCVYQLYHIQVDTGTSTLRGGSYVGYLPHYYQSTMHSNTTEIHTFLMHAEPFHLY